MNTILSLRRDPRLVCICVRGRSTEYPERMIDSPCTGECVAAIVVGEQLLLWTTIDAFLVEQRGSGLPVMFVMTTAASHTLLLATSLRHHCILALANRFIKQLYQ